MDKVVNIAIIIMIILIAALLLQRILKKMDHYKDDTINDLKDEAKKLCSMVDKESNVYYLDELKTIKLEEKDIDINNLDNNIATIDINGKQYDYTFKINLCSNICTKLKFIIIYLFVKNNCFLVCFQKEYVGALIFNENNIIVSSQDFQEMNEIRKFVVEYISNDSK
ncbi:hypothetical protein [Clostridium sp. 001]|uniref:hypothetical protein n=1 Tax=Clostridium sp. 001 TaxID=1970093 RepID=UPI001C2BE9A4|nr:hypothetical protein [Clostridium sp. 001]QXE20054.1 hypothetical protein B5S50_15140 [Clostridium sp. 001]